VERYFKIAGRATGLFLFVAILLVTNKWFNYDEAIRVMGADDTISYRAIAEAWPGLPSDPLPFHRAQRLAVPYVLGGIAGTLGCSLDSVFLGATLLSCAAVLLLMHKIFVSLALSATQRLLLFALLIFNPFVFRPYLAARFMVIDLVFITGLTLLLWGLLTNRGAATVLGIALAALGRQTALAVLPVVVVWLNTGAWKARPARERLLFMLLLPSSALGIYCVTGLAASEVSEGSRNLEHLTGLLYWFAHFWPREFRDLLEFVFRGLTSSTVTLMILGAVYARTRKLVTPPAFFWLLLVLVASIWAQPFLGGPAVTGGNIVRLCALGFVPLLTALAVLLSRSRILSKASRSQLIILTLLIIAGSFHHLTSNVGSALHYGVAGFVIIHCVLAGLTGTIFFLMSGPRAEVTGTGSG
jgi:hypothetical protein